MSSFNYTHAIVCKVPNTYETNALGIIAPIDLDKARKQHDSYVSALSDAGLKVIVLPAKETHPDSVFVEDVAVVCDGKALMTRPALPSRATEVEYMRGILKDDLGLNVVEIDDKTATLEGGDVIFTGKEFFVGLSNRTNKAGAKAVASSFPKYPCTAVKLDKALHIKSLLSMAGPDVISVSTDPEAQDTLQRLLKEAKFKYQIVTVPDSYAANVINANGYLLHRSAEDFPESAKVFKEKLPHLKLKPLLMSEMEKSDARITCCSILVNKSGQV